MHTIRRGLLMAALATAAVTAAGAAAANAATDREVTQPPAPCSLHNPWYVPMSCGTGGEGP
jgi:ABC-type sugar transport system substrate-binding protein